jgi:hypothetical protein
VRLYSPEDLGVVPRELKILGRVRPWERDRPNRNGVREKLRQDPQLPVYAPEQVLTIS